MYKTFSGHSINNLFYQILKDALENWPKGVKRRDDRLTWDSPGPVCVHLTNPRNRVLTIPGRNSSFPATCAETLWVLAGRDDVKFLEPFLPRAKDFSDDGKIWRAGYGPRLRGHNFYDNGWEVYRTDQIDTIVYELSHKPESRRAVIGLLEPYYDLCMDWRRDVHNMDSKDFPCTQSLSFMVRSGKLDLTVFIRSNDLIWGWSHCNVFEFCVLQELVSIMTNIPLGEFYIISNSLHVYEDMENRVSKILELPRFDVYDHLQAHIYAPCDYSFKDFDEDVGLGVGVIDKGGYDNFGSVLVTKTFLRDYVVAACAVKREPWLMTHYITDAPSAIAVLEWARRTQNVEGVTAVAVAAAWLANYPQPVQRYITGAI